MTEKKGTTTDRLTDVIHAVLLSRQTGIIEVERIGGENTQENGTISFSKGIVVDASLGSIRGMEALNRLKNWKMCRFSFTHTIVSKSSPLAPITSQTTQKNIAAQPTPPLPTIAPAHLNQPSMYGFSTQQERNITQFPANRYLARLSPLNERNTDPIPLNGQLQPQERISDRFPVTDFFTDPTTHSRERFSDHFPVDEHLAYPSQPAAQENDALRHIPTRIQNAGDTFALMTQRGLTRTHRHLFLLINGQRNVIELAQITGKSLSDIQTLLQALAQAGFIYL